MTDKPAVFDPWLSTRMLIEMYPFLHSGDPENPRRKIHRLIGLGHFPEHDGRMGRELLWRQSTIERAIEDGLNDRDREAAERRERRREAKRERVM